MTNVPSHIPVSPPKAFAWDAGEKALVIDRPPTTFASFATVPPNLLGAWDITRVRACNEFSAMFRHNRVTHGGSHAIGGTLAPQVRKHDSVMHERDKDDVRYPKAARLPVIAPTRAPLLPPPTHAFAFTGSSVAFRSMVGVRRVIGRLICSGQVIVAPVKGTLPLIWK
jgi:hypothetical protein